MIGQPCANNPLYVFIKVRRIAVLNTVAIMLNKSGPGHCLTPCLVHITTDMLCKRRSLRQCEGRGKKEDLNLFHVSDMQES